MRSDKSVAFANLSTWSGSVAMDYLVFEFMGLAMAALCVIVMIVPSPRAAPSERARPR